MRIVEPALEPGSREANAGSSAIEVYEREASECIRVAEHTAEPARRAYILDTAHQYLRLAERLHKFSRLTGEASAKKPDATN